MNLPESLARIRMATAIHGIEHAGIAVGIAGAILMVGILPVAIIAATAIFTAIPIGVIAGPGGIKGPVRTGEFHLEGGLLFHQHVLETNATTHANAIGQLIS